MSSLSFVLLFVVLFAQAQSWDVTMADADSQWVSLSLRISDPGCRCRDIAREFYRLLEKPRPNSRVLVADASCGAVAERMKYLNTLDVNTLVAARQHWRSNLSSVSGAVGQLFKFGERATLLCRDRAGVIQEDLGDHNALYVERGFHIIHVALAGSGAVDVFVRSVEPLSSRATEELSRKVLSLLDAKQVRLFVRRDPWFLEESLRLGYPYRAEEPPSTDVLQDAIQINCVARLVGEAVCRVANRWPER